MYKHSKIPLGEDVIMLRVIKSLSLSYPISERIVFGDITWVSADYKESIIKGNGNVHIEDN